MIITRVLSRLCCKLLVVVSLVAVLGEMCCSLDDDQFEQEGSNPWFEHVVEDFNENVTVTADTDVFLECMIDNPTFLDWQKDDKAIEVTNAYRERRVYIIRGEGLLVLNAEYNDRGHYMCLGIRNTYLIQKTISLDVAPSSDDDQPLRTYPIECGIPRLRGKIIGGKTTEEGQAPWMALLWNTKVNRLFCGGVLINQRWVLTAAHCFNSYKYNIKEHMEVRLGEFDIFQEEGTEKILHVEQIIVHSGYDKVTFDSDIALLKLSQPVTYTDYIVPICMPSEMRALNLLQARTRGFITGWGRTAEMTEVTTRYLKRVRLLIMDQRMCNNRHRNVITNSMFCAVSDERPVARDSCSGDSGSPFAVRENKRWYLIGLVSWGRGCASPRFPGVYTRVHRYTHWINSLTGDDTDTCAGLQEKLSDMTSQLSRQQDEIQLLREQLNEKRRQENETSSYSTRSPDLYDTPHVPTSDPTQPPVYSRQSTPSLALRIPCLQGSCMHVGGFHVRAVCEDDFCSCESPHYSRESCLPRYGSCVIKHDVPSAIALPSYQDETQMTYSCLADDNPSYRVHVLAVYEGNRHTRPPTAGDMEVELEGGPSDGDRRGLVLVLASFEPVNWNIHITGQPMMDRVILISVYNSTVTITSPENEVRTDIPVVTLSGPRGYGNDSGGGGNTAGMLRIINETVGPLVSFTGTYRADTWLLNVGETFGLPDPG